jgi:hypothetical protein
VTPSLTPSPSGPPCQGCESPEIVGQFGGAGSTVFDYLICNTVDQYINFQWVSLDRPNRFGVYDSNGLVYSTGWKGFANYPGIWGPSLNTNTSGNENVCFTSLTGRYVRVDVGSADPSNPVSDYFTWDLTCLGTCPGVSPTPSVTRTPTPTPSATPPAEQCIAYRNLSNQPAFYSWISCDGVQFTNEEIINESAICARSNSLVYVSGGALTPQGNCGTPTPLASCQAVFNPNAQVVFVQFVDNTGTTQCNIVAPNETIIFCVRQGSIPVAYADFPCGTGSTIGVVITPQGTLCNGIGQCYPSEYYPITVYQGNTCDCLNLCIDANR